MLTGTLVQCNQDGCNSTNLSPDGCARLLRQGNWPWASLAAIALCCAGGWLSPAIAQNAPNPDTTTPVPPESVADPLRDEPLAEPAPESSDRLAEPAPKLLPEPILDIGIVQRFGEKKTDTVVLEAMPGDQFTLRFETGGQPQEVTTDRITLDVVMEPLAAAKRVEVVVLSNHRSFESAEDSAKYWRSQGIEVELAQPRQWQVWGKRSVYHTPLLRRLLLQNLRAHGAKTSFLQSRTLQEKNQAAFVVNGFRYHRDRVEIDSTQDQAWLQVNAREQAKRLYGGDFRLQPNAYGSYTLVNEVPLETYLRGVVPYEIGLAAPRTTIEAQAILARTYSLRNLRRFTIDDYELCADTQCQVYWGISGAADITDRAIAATRGQVLTYNDELVDALYSSTTGGVTAAFSDVWNGPDRPYLKAVVDSVYGLWDLNTRDLSTDANLQEFLSLQDGFNEVGWDAFRWRREGTMQSLAEDVRRYLEVIQHPMLNFSTLEKLEVTERSPSGRVQTLVVTTNLGKIELGKDEVIRALYPPRSTLFYLEPIYEPTPAIQSNDYDASTVTKVEETDALSEKSIDPTDLTEVNSTSTPEPPRVLKGYAFVGGGFGHGVGMSQTGAYKLGQLGWSHDRILSFYYPGTTLQPLHENLTFWVDPEER
ncbi:MAG: SpoIID/LytB domain-containing protein [Cyanothece sp. SIO2G6]|nr:SpoIID/LytB domain-containing protein [Cyanothece sp. SIO2G6]